MSLIQIILWFYVLPAAIVWGFLNMALNIKNDFMFGDLHDFLIQYPHMVWVSALTPGINLFCAIIITFILLMLLFTNSGF